MLALKEISVITERKANKKLIGQSVTDSFYGFIFRVVNVVEITNNSNPCILSSKKVFSSAEDFHSIFRYQRQNKIYIILLKIFY